MELTLNGKRVSPEMARPDWTKRCLSCGAPPILPITGLCGPCTFGEADMSGGAWWDEEDDAAPPNA